MTECGLGVMGGCKVLSSNIQPKIKSKYTSYQPYIRYDHTFFGIKWYTNMVSGQGKGKSLMDDYRSEDLKGHLVICYTKQYKIDYVQHLYAVFDSYIEFYNYYNQFALKDCCFYEVVQFYQKPHFDIDIRNYKINNLLNIYYYYIINIVYKHLYYIIK